MLIRPQAPNTVIMVRPHYFTPNLETRADNTFQVRVDASHSSGIAKKAYEQVSQAVGQLSDAGITVKLFEDETTVTPDSVFPNNWFSTHPGGQIVLYPMYAKNRRKERRPDIIEYLKQTFFVQEITDYSAWEVDEIFLEGTGSMVLDHLERVVYAAHSKRCDARLLERFCTQFNYNAVTFDAVNRDNIAVYHTNVLLCIGTQFAMGGFNMIPDAAQRSAVIGRLQRSGRQIIELSEAQVNAFCGNALELSGDCEPVLALSQTAYNALTQEQISVLSDSVELLPIDVSAIEMAGGSIRCMLAGVHLSERLK